MITKRISTLSLAGVCSALCLLVTTIRASEAGPPARGREEGRQDDKKPSESRSSEPSAPARSREEERQDDNHGSRPRTDRDRYVERVYVPVWPYRYGDDYRGYQGYDRWERDYWSPRYADKDAAYFPNGRGLVFASNRDGRGYDLYRLDLTGPGTPVRLTRNPADDTEPTVSPDGHFVAYVSEREGRAALYRIRTDGSELTRLSPRGGYLGEARISAPTWSPDNRWIVFTAERGGVARLYRLSPRGGEIQALSDNYPADNSPYRDNLP